MVSIIVIILIQLSCCAALLLHRAQGLALKDALTSAPPFTITLKFPDIPTQKDIGLESLSGTSMATPTAAGVAGLVWGAHTECTAAEIRNALLNTALMPSAGAESDTNGVGVAGSKRNDQYGRGIVQAMAAHKYLEAKPCVGDRGILGEISVAGTAKQPVGAVISVSIKVRPEGLMYNFHSRKRLLHVDAFTTLDGTLPNRMKLDESPNGI